MRDLELWSGEPTPATLQAFAGWSMPRRVPYFGRLLALVEHADPEMRAAALHALGGCRGVTGVRALVHALADPDVNVRAAALTALRTTSRDAPDRYAHALFHPDVTIRRAALLDVPHAATQLAIYLRADPACADLAATAAWPRAPLPLAFDLHAAGTIGARELLELVLRMSGPDAVQLFTTQVRRPPERVDAYLESLATAPALLAAPGRDVIDQLVGAIHRVVGDADLPLGTRGLEHLLATVASRKSNPLAKRAVTSLLSRVGGAMNGADRAVLGAAIALEPRLLEHRAIRALGEDHVADAAISGLFRFQWPTRPARAQVERLLELPYVHGDLGLAVAVVGLNGGARLKRLKKLFGESDIVNRLTASDRGWDQLCSLPLEDPALDLAWLARVAKLSSERYVVLAARALGVFRDKRLDTFVDQIPRKHRASTFLALAKRTDLDRSRITAAAHAIAARLDRAAAMEILAELLRGEAADVVMARALARELPDKLLASAVSSLEDTALVRLVEVIEGPEALPRDREIALANAIAGRAHPVLQSWSGRMRLEEPAVVATHLPARARAIDEVERHRIATCSDSDLEAALASALDAPVSGLVPALAGRAEVSSVPACVALLACGDPPAQVARELDRFADTTPRFAERLDHAMTVAWNHVAALPPLAHARLFRWEAHTDALVHWIDAQGGALAAVMFANALPGRLASLTLWSGVAEVVVMWRYRDRVRLQQEGSLDLARYCASRVDRPIGRHAARILVALVEGGVVGLTAVRDIVLDRTADANAEAREQLARLVRLEGMPEPPKGVDTSVPASELIQQIKASRDVRQLEVWCADPRRAVVEEAVLALVLLGEQGQARLATLLPRLDDLPMPVPILASIGLWDSSSAIFAARELAARGVLKPQWMYHLSLGLGDHAGALAAVRAPASDLWFRREDWNALIAAVNARRCAIELADSPHHHAYQRAVPILIDEPAADDVRDALIRFLETGSDRPHHLRRGAASRLLLEHHSDAGLPLLIEQIAEPLAPQIDEPARMLDGFPSHAATVAKAIVDATLIGGITACTEKRMWQVLELLRPRLDPKVLAPLFVRILEEASTSLARRTASHLVVGEVLMSERLRRIAEVFAWGIRRGVELTGRLFRIHLTSKERDLGHTFLSGNRIFVSPLPMLRRDERANSEPFGQDVVEGLLLHEIGHHAYHRGEEPQALWKQAHDEGIGHLLNLIADEHLERNLRGVDRGYGDRLKRLDAFAFMHGAHEVQVSVLLDSLRGSSAAALCATELGVAFDESSIRLRRGTVLSELERLGHPLARFARALRMGLGNRHADPIVEEALALCGANLRKLDMRGLYDLTVELAQLFGGACSIARVFGGPEGIEFGERDDDVFGGLDDEILQREVERILDPRRNKSHSPPGPRDRLCINVNPDDEFDKITHIERVRGDAVAHRAIVRDIARHAHRLRAFLDDLGLRWDPHRRRTQGRALDRTALRALVTRNDPRILIAREPTRRTDLFLGTIVDCSGSMTAGDNISRAKRFAVLVAEAVRPLAGVEARFFGFTDSVIYDAGDAQDCDVTGLEAGGGNNDAAALLHAANIAAGSQKRAKVLVMISDGLPTECSVAAVRGLVTQLTRRRGLICAQVAVRKIEEDCFPHHVLLDDAQPDIAVAKFGRMIADLARRGLAQ